jgi:ABC-type antimicrobial peptide transport system permease subunit
MLRQIGGVVGGVVVWFLIANVGNHVLRVTWPGYSEVEVAKTFTLGMLTARQLLGAISSLCAGFVAAWVTNRSMFAIKSLAGLLLIMFLPVMTLWERFPPWYHVVFLASLVVVTLLGGLLYPRRRSRSSTNL